MPYLLVVEDDPDVRNMIGLALEVDGHYVTSAATSVEALTALTRIQPDAAVIDAVLPADSGLTLANRVVDLGVPVIIMTGEPATQRQLDRCGCPYVPKPFCHDELLAQTRQVLSDAEHQTHRVGEPSQRLKANMEKLREAIENARAIVEQIQAECVSRMKRDGLDR